MICPMKQIMNLDSKYIDSYFQKKKKVHISQQKKKKSTWILTIRNGRKKLLMCTL